MRMNMFAVCFACAVVVSMAPVSDIHGQTGREKALEEAESRLRAIYEHGEFRAKRFRADWLSDSSGYTVSEPVPGADEKVLARYDVASGKRTVLDSSKKEEGDRS